MRFQNWLDNKYIGISEKNETPVDIPSDIENIINKLNRFLPTKNKKYKFSLVSENEFRSPSDVIKINKVKLNKMIQKWYEANEELENIKEKHKKGLHSI